MAFHVGQKVVCIDDHWARLGGLPPLIVKGNIYVVSEIGLTHPLDPQKLPCIRVAEIPYGAHWAHRFRAIVEKKTDISIFTEMLKPKQRELISP